MDSCAHCQLCQRGYIVKHGLHSPVINPAGSNKTVPANLVVQSVMVSLKRTIAAKVGTALQVTKQSQCAPISYAASVLLRSKTTASQQLEHTCSADQAPASPSHLFHDYLLLKGHILKVCFTSFMIKASQVQHAMDQENADFIQQGVPAVNIAFWLPARAPLPCLSI